MKRKPEIFIHEQPSPFPWTTRSGQVIVDERCHCGALRSEHMDTLAFGHGAFPPNKCEKFTWAEFVGAEERST